ncbi:glyoxalase [Pseudalkalibacillus hwajinpoensis]|uniref:Glyoxalase n=1 Tax=Guptibacillus hwajinpoensis TaxID=208199 RepID=A0A4V5PZ25_9BACL|nr:glyoxalase [Pseudalkalibacillus hwajinpoensis]TKD72298.1 glyoxalase [Pseudalkalibacillus hwajinpoensis]
MYINKLTLYSHVVNDLRDFYVEKFGFRLVKSDKSGFEIKVGKSVLAFKQTTNSTTPFYHFAFTIPVNKFKEAKAWAKEKVTLTKEENKDEIFFMHINAQSFYFIDPAGNIVELISRKLTAPCSETLGFSVEEILTISEINLTTTKVDSVGEELLAFGIPVRDDEPLQNDSLNFLGEAEGGSFILLGPANRRWIFSNQYSVPYPLIIEVDNIKQIELNGRGEVHLSYKKRSVPQRFNALGD